MVYGIIIAIVFFGVMIYFGTKKKEDDKIIKIVVNEDYVSVPSNLTKFEEDLLRIINNHRLEIYSGLTGTIVTIDNTDEGARNECYKHNKYMIQLQIDNPNLQPGNHHNFPDRVRQMKINGAERVGEVVSYGYGSSAGTIKGFLTSPGHKKILEELGWTHVGIRALRNPKGRYFVTIIFYR